MRSLLREPLLHFLVIGAALFGLYGLVGKKEAEAPTKIVVSAERVANLVDRFARTWRRPPTQEELDGLVEDDIRDEVFYREGRAAGLDRDDVVIRRRVRQKMEFLAEDMAASAPSEEQLAAYLAFHAERFRTEDRLTFRHVFLSATRRGEALEGDAREIAATLVGATAPVDTAAAWRSLPARRDVSADAAQRCRAHVRRRFREAAGGRRRRPVARADRDRVSERISSSSTNEPREACRRSTPSGKKSGARG